MRPAHFVRDFHGLPLSNCLIWLESGVQLSESYGAPGGRDGKQAQTNNRKACRKSAADGSL